MQSDAAALVDAKHAIWGSAKTGAGLDLLEKGYKTGRHACV